jgi:hypothetical protein
MFFNRALLNKYTEVKMGRVFTPAELIYGLHPNHSSFGQAADDYMEGIARIARDLDAEQEFGYMIHGSVGRQTETIHSDIDIVVVYPHRLALESLQQVGALLAKIGMTYHIPIEDNVISDHEAAAGHHRIHPMFGAYLRQAQDSSRYIVGRPIDKIVVPNGDAYEADMLDYLILKRDGFTGALHNYNGADIDWQRFGKALELPKSLADKYRQLGEMGLRQLFVPGDEGNTLRHIAQRTRGLADEIIAGAKSQDAIEAYMTYVRNNYLNAIVLAAKICTYGAYEYQEAMETPQPNIPDPGTYRPRASSC